MIIMDFTLLAGKLLNREVEFFVYEVSTNIETKPLKPVGEKLDGVIEEERIVADRVDTPDGATLSKSWSR